MRYQNYCNFDIKLISDSSSLSFLKTTDFSEVCFFTNFMNFLSSNKCARTTFWVILNRDCAPEDVQNDTNKNWDEFLTIM